MELTWSSDQEDFRSSVRSFLESRSPVTRARDISEGDAGFDREVWTQMATQLGLQAMAVPEDLGGADFGLPEQLIVLEELGRVLYSGPFLSTVISTAALLGGSGEAREALLPRIADGSAIVVLAEAEGGSFFDVAERQTRAEVTDGTVTITGAKTWVLDAPAATVFLVTARSDDGLVLVAVDATADGVTVEVASSLDRTRPLARVTFDGAPGQVVSDARVTSGLLDHVRDVAVSALAAEQLGVAERCLELAVAYTHVREQFGRPVGSFQALKHRAADVLTGVEAARSAVLYAAWAATDEPDELAIAASVAGAQASTVSLQAAQENIQMHGGIGFTWEHDAHLYLRRAKSGHVLFGSPTDHRGRLADLVSL